MLSIGRPPRVHVPTVAELAAEGLARPVGGSAGSPVYRIEPEGQRRIYAAMKENGRPDEPAGEGES